MAGCRKQPVVDQALGGFARLDPFVHLLVEKMTCAGDARHEIACVQGDEVRELEGGHAHTALDRCLDGCVSLRQSDWLCSSRDQSELIDCAFRLLWILDIDQAYTAFDILHFESFRILGGDVARCVSTCSVCPFRRDVARYVSTEGTNGTGRDAACYVSTKYAEGFKVKDIEGGVRLVDIQNPQEPKSTVYQFALIPRGTKPVGLPEGYTPIETPIQSCMCMTSLQLSNFIALDACDFVTGITSTRHLFNEQMNERIKTGKTAKSLINDRLLSAARQLLVDETLSITQISQHLGFEYPQHFVRFFKAQTGKTPSEYRKTA